MESRSGSARRCSLGRSLHPITIVALVVSLNVYWVGILQIFGAYFERVAGAPLLDLENTRSILSAYEAQRLIEAYGSEARALYVPFFIMDSVAPPLVFASFALLWVLLLRPEREAWADRLLASPLLFMPLGVGFFDWWENLAFLNAIMAAPGAAVTQTLQIGLVFVWLKAACLFATFAITGLLLLFRGYALIKERLPILSRQRS